MSLKGKSAVVTGAGGTLGTVFCQTLARAGATVWVGSRREAAATAIANELNGEGHSAQPLIVDVMNRESLEAAGARVGAPDILVNCAGGNSPGATTSPEKTFFDLPLDDLQHVVGLNLFGGAILPCQVFGQAMAQNPAGGSIVNITSMTAMRPLTRIPGYSSAKAAVSNFTAWLAVHLAQGHNSKLRVNAIAPGFFLTDQNRFLLVDEATGGMTSRGAAILAHTPMGRFGQPEDLAGTLLWLCSDASAFVTGAVIPVDGGFSAFSGV